MLLMLTLLQKQKCKKENQTHSVSLLSYFQAHDYKTDQAVTFWSENYQQVQVGHIVFIHISVFTLVTIVKPHYIFSDSFRIFMV